MTKEQHYLQYQIYTKKAENVRQKMKELEAELEGFEFAANQHFNQWLKEAKLND